MRYLHQYKRTSSLKVQKWIENNIPELTAYQKETIRYDEMIRFSPFYWYEKRQKEKVNPLFRLTIIPFFVIMLILLIGLPVNFLFVGRWGYGNKMFNTLSKWQNKLGF